MYDPQPNSGRRFNPTDANSNPGISSMEVSEEEPDVSFSDLPISDLLRVVQKRMWVIVLVIALLGGLALGYSLTRTPTYEASIKILVGQERVTSFEQQREDVQNLQKLTQTMVEGVNSYSVAHGVIQQLGLQMTPQEFLNHLRVEQTAETQFIRVSYTDPSPETAQQVANTVGDVFAEQVSEVSPSGAAITATVWDQAERPDEPVSPKPVRDTFLALLLGLILGVGLAFLLESLDVRWRSPEEAERITGVPTFGVIPKPKSSQSNRKEDADSRNAQADRLVTIKDPSGAASEAYRSLRTNLLYSLVDNPPKVIVLTSPGPNEGKSTICANLGIVLAQADKSVLIVDCDFRRPVIHKYFEPHNLYGIINVLAGERTLPEVWQEPVERLKVVMVGPVPPNPAELLGSQRLSELLDSVRKEFDYIFVDAPPVGLVSDPVVLATQGDGVLLVLDAQDTRKGAARQAVRNLGNVVGANVLGTVMNNAEGSVSEYYDVGYTYATSSQAKKD